MKKSQCFILSGMGLAGFALAPSCDSSLRNQEPARPNIIYILADDLGYGELGIYGQGKIETPNIDMLARAGVLFTQHYTGAPVCAPARNVLLTGLHTGNSQIRGNEEWAERGNVRDYRAMLADSTLEGQRPMAAETITFAHLLQNVGYSTSLFGKWGLGAPHTESVPNKMGFDYFMGYNCQRQAHTYYPLHLYENSSRIYLKNDTVAPHTRLPADADLYDESNYAPFNLQEYACDVMFDAMTNHLYEIDPAKTGKPFFLYWATPIPHVPLQAPQRWVDYYVEKFGDEEPYDGRSGYFPTRYPRATYAAMVSYFDEQVGLLIKQLKEMGEYENTLIIFTSDNGASFSGGADSPWFDSNMPFGNDYGRSKGFLHEGGIRVPMVAVWHGKIKPGRISHHISAFWDVMPTFCEIAGAEVTVKTDGISFLPELIGKEQSKHEFLYWELHEYGGQQAVRWGNWKGIRKNIFRGNMEIELYNLENDKEEQNNVAALHPDVVSHIEKIMKESHTPARFEKFNFAFN
jgi:arylsulfatase A-like enzyme